MRKRIISVITFLSIILSLAVFNVSAEDKSSFEHKVETLKALGIIEENVLISEETGIRRGDFLKSVCAFFTVTHDNDASRLKFAEDLGIISSAENFDSDREVTYEEAVKMIVSAVGFSTYAQCYGGYPGGYIAVGNSIGLTDKTYTGKVNAPVIVNLLHNALEIDIAKPVSFADGIMTSELMKEEGALSIYRNIQRIEGVVTADDKTSLNDSEGTPEGYIGIDDEIYEVVCEYPESIIGCPVIAYIYNYDDSGEVLHIEAVEKKVKRETVSGDSVVDVSLDISKITYDENGKEKIRYISPIVKVIYNDVICSDYTSDDFMPESGELKLVDTDDDRYVDIIHIDSYETVIADGVSIGGNFVKNKFVHIGATDKIELDANEDDYRFTLTKDGKAITLSDIKKYDVLNVAQSKDGKYKKVIVTSSVVQGTVKTVNNNERKVTVTVNGEDVVYDISGVYYKSETVNTAGINKITLGKLQDFYFDCYGRIAAVKNVTGKDKTYVWAVKCYTNEDSDDGELWLKYLDSEDEWKVSKFVQKPYVNGKKEKLDVAVKKLGTGNNFEHQLLRIKLDDAGEITDVDIAAESDTYLNGEFTVSNKYSMTYRSPALYTSGNKNVFYPSGAATVFIIPQTTADFDERNYIVNTGYFAYNRGYDVRAYDVDEFSCSDIFVVETSSTEKPVSTTNKYLLISETGTKVSSSGEVTAFMKGDLGNYKNIELSLSEHNLGIDPESLGKGDYVVFDIDREGKAVNVEILIDCSEGNVQKEQSYRGGQYKIDKGIVTKVGTDNSMIVLDYGSNILPFKVPSSCYLYDQAENTYTAAKIEDISEGDYVAITRDGYTLTMYTAIIYRFREVK